MTEQNAIVDEGTEDVPVSVNLDEPYSLMVSRGGEIMGMTIDYIDDNGVTLGGLAPENTYFILVGHQWPSEERFSIILSQQAYQ